MQNPYLPLQNRSEALVGEKLRSGLPITRKAGSCELAEGVLSDQLSFPSNFRCRVLSRSVDNFSEWPQTLQSEPNPMINYSQSVDEVEATC